MSGFEVIVRPVVFPNIRPSPPRVLAPEDDPEQGMATIGGGGGKVISLPHSWSLSVSQQLAEQRETKRQFDKERVYQKNPTTGVINQDNWVEIERLKRVRLETSEGPVKVAYSNPPKVDNVKTIATDQTRES